LDWIGLDEGRWREKQFIGKKCSEQIDRQIDGHTDRQKDGQNLSIKMNLASQKYKCNRLNFFVQPLQTVSEVN